MDVYANGMSIACKAASGKSVAAMPDVCLSPPSPPAGPVPIPYPNTSMASDTDRGSKTVQIEGQEVMLKNSSTFKKSNGNEAATKSLGMGVVTHTIQGESSFASWSMDVKFEGANVPRHMDMMLHNEQCDPANTPVWQYLEKQAAAAGKKCESLHNDVKTECTEGKEYSAKCCSARKCLLVAYKPNRCCSKKGKKKGSKPKKMTPHHLVPSKLFVAHENRGDSVPAGEYNSKLAPCLCVVGNSHTKGTEHGDVGTKYTELQNKFLKTENRPPTVKEACSMGAECVKESSSKCDDECVKAQLVAQHKKMIGKDAMNDPPPRSPAPKPPKKSPIKVRR